VAGSSKEVVVTGIESDDTRDIERIMDSFAEIKLSPVTIGKRLDAKHLRNLYSYFL